MVESCNGCTNKGSNPEHPMVIPSLFIVVDNGGSKTSSRVDARTRDRNGGQVNHEHSKPNW
uniref:Uncharacterized protein n=1 Tax=Cannabis sativa TaxID=3483 RepID=A0A803R5T7_CANSA